MRPTDFISFIALFLAIFASIFSVIIYVKEVHIEDQINHFHHNNLNITSIVCLDKDIAHLFKTLGMENNRAERLRKLLKINANATSNFTEGKRRTTKPNHRIFNRSTTIPVQITRARNSFNKSTRKN